MKQDKHARQMERYFMAMVFTFIVLAFVGLLSLGGCAPVQVQPGCEDSWAADQRVDFAMNAGAIGLSEYLLQNPGDRPEARKAIKAVIVVLKQDVVTLDVVVSALQKGTSSREVRARLGYVAILGTGRQSGVALDACEKEYLIGYFERLLLMIE